MRAGGDTPRDLQTAEKQLTALSDNDRLFYGGYYLIPAELEKLDPKETESEKAKAVRMFMRSHIKTRGEAFFLNGDGRLCFVQALTITDVPAMIAELNAMISSEVNDGTAAVLAGTVKPEAWMDPETIKLLHKASSKKSFDWVKLEPGRVTFTVPMSPAGAANFKRQLFQLKDIQALRKQVDGLPSPDGRKYDVRESLLALELVATFFADLPLSVDQRPDHMAFAVGVGAGQPLRVAAPLDESVKKKGAQDEELIKLARTLKVPFREGMTADGAIAAFLKTVDR
jgi:hypothetical protein